MQLVTALTLANRYFPQPRSPVRFSQLLPQEFISQCLARGWGSDRASTPFASRIVGDGCARHGALSGKRCLEHCQ